MVVAMETWTNTNGKLNLLNASSPSVDVVTMDPIVIVSTMTKKQERKLRADSIA
ncbi:A-type inclusion protein [Vaccinia virus]|uniref:A-type inclusion protein n=1 Tax=Vaccinia virus TaxID=10245 RepID=M9WEX1_VACCV|nr:A-type inclusion protein [Vaccinia virus]AGJ91608.1 A-type inclusion protein [Vaccinia virus]AGJ91878.1 A-type inclusion protein [Vaccinia virus]AGJ92151.1 A-type inclusion protein [Vaccinia virus]AGJ92426.1 A-type inclusion protein [Vaccinia virus]